MGAIPTLPVIARKRNLLPTESQKDDIFVSWDTKVLGTADVPSSIKPVCEIPEEARKDALTIQSTLSWLNKGLPVVGHIDGSISYSTDPFCLQDRYRTCGVATQRVSGSVVSNFFVGGLLGALAVDTSHLKQLSKSCPPAGSSGANTYEESATITNMESRLFISPKQDFINAMPGLKLDQQKPLLENPGSLYRIVLDDQHTTQKTNHKLIVPFKGAQQKAEEIVFEEGPRMSKLKSVTEETSKPELPLTLWDNEMIASRRSYFGASLFNRVCEMTRSFEEYLQASVQESDEPREEKSTASLKSLQMFLQDTRISKLMAAAGQENRLKQLQEATDPQIIITGIKESLQAAKQISKESVNSALIQRHITHLRALDLNNLRYDRVGDAMLYTAANGSNLGALVSEWASNPSSTSLPESGYRTKTRPKASVELPNSTQIYSTGQINLCFLGGQNLPIVEEKIDCTGITMKNGSLKFSACFEGKQSEETVMNIALNCFSEVSQQSRLVKLYEKTVGREWTEYTATAEKDAELIARLASADMVQMTAYSSESGILRFKDIKFEIQLGEPRITRTVTDPEHHVVQFREPGVVERYEISSEPVPLFEKMPLRAKQLVEGIEVNFEAMDQGEGKREGTVLLRFWDEKGLYWDSNLICGRLQHSWTTYHHSSEINPPVQIQALQLMGVVGSSGQQSLYIKNVTLKAKVNQTEEEEKVADLRQQLSSDNSYYHDSDSEEKVVLQTHKEMNFSKVRSVVLEPNEFKTEETTTVLTPLKNELIPIDCTATNIKIAYRAKGVGSLVMAIWKGGSDESKMINISNGNTAKQQREYLFEADPAKVGLARGDSIQFFYRSVQSLKVSELQYHLTTNFVKQTISVGEFISHRSTDDLIPITTEFFQIGYQRVERITAQFSGNDQGWGNRKGQVFLKVIQPDNRQHVISLTNGQIFEHHSTQFNYETADEEVTDLITPMSKVYVMCRVGGGGGHSINIRGFRVELFFLEREDVAWIAHKSNKWSENSQILAKSQIESITLKAELSDLPGDDVRLQITNPLTKTVTREILLINGAEATQKIEITVPADFSSQIAVGDVLKLKKDGPPDSSKFTSFKLQVEFKKLQLPPHRVISCEFTDGAWTESDGLSPTNIVGADCGIIIKARILAASVSCSWRDHPTNESTGRLYLVLKRNGSEECRLDLFGLVNHEESQKLVVLDSNSPIVKLAEPGDQISLERQLGSNGQLNVRNLELIVVCSPP